MFSKGKKKNSFSFNDENYFMKEKLIENYFKL